MARRRHPRIRPMKIRVFWNDVYFAFAVGIVVGIVCGYLWWAL